MLTTRFKSNYHWATFTLMVVLSVRSAWLAAYEHPVVDRINQRIQDITGLDVTTAEELQVWHWCVKVCICVFDTVFSPLPPLTHSDVAIYLFSVAGLDGISILLYLLWEVYQWCLSFYLNWFSFIKMQHYNNHVDFSLIIKITRLRFLSLKKIWNIL